ncbi:hypothetical protein CONPUDRAFT_158507 [Coniophora puteana RWD-64-598 SS2]|uniref:Uncharacterized protein n=1 Tax=Coniophora puteana (strain RWD-64-598) TaxID=741705 RepID=A0A5M3MB47_CONPW|nr:uncharacterized protein CONPUDRAFT_158507 [Coniophora puteana RWD-64-598 SS2]EIW76488.1 hypothetical protein CONPUDRAFT_158507 [Coniophora puteana RWD-64-598 SS2]
MDTTHHSQHIPVAIVADLQIVGVTTIIVERAEPAEDTSTVPPTPAFILRRIVSPRGRALAVGDRISAFLKRDPKNPNSGDVLAFRGEISASQTVADQEAPTHLRVGPRDLIGYTEEFSNLRPLHKAPVTLYASSAAHHPIPLPKVARTLEPPFLSWLRQLIRATRGLGASNPSPLKA